MRVLVLGAGMYVTGRDGTGHGTILASLAQISRTSPIERVLVVARDPANADHVRAASERINGMLRTRLQVHYATTPGLALEDEIAALCGCERFDCAIVSTPDHLHGAPLRALLRAGIPVLVVKPLVPTLAEAQELVDLQHNTGTYGAVEFHKRFDESNLYARKVINEGLLGKLLYMSVDYSQRIQIPSRVFRGWVEHTNIFQYLGVHYVDLAWFLTGFTPRCLTAYGTRGILQEQGIDAFDSVHVQVEWANPADEYDRVLTHFNTNWIDPNCTSAMSDQRFKVVGSQGRIECDQRNRGIELVSEGRGVALVNPYFFDYLPDADGNPCFQGYGLKSIAQFFLDVRQLADGETTLAHLEARRPSFRQALVSTAVVDAVNQALAAPPAWREINGLS